MERCGPSIRRPGSTFAFEVTGGEEAFALLDNFQIMKLAVSLGGAKTLISHRASITPALRANWAKKSDCRMR